MKLLNAETMRLEEHYDETTPKYTILSHRWRQEEVLYGDIMGDWTAAKKKLGFRKIELCLKQTLKDGYRYCWIDTCCIDKSSSSELSEAINSMYTWYRGAGVCYAYLDDVPITTLRRDNSEIVGETGYINGSRIFFSSGWWTRGWTLQELIAPREVCFYSKDWNYLGTRTEHGRRIAEITGINQKILDNGTVGKASVAQRMFWASKRKTTRIEDMAYCLMGIFELNMPLLYGEGKRSFIRLQEEIIKNIDDQSIFAWTSETASQSVFRGLLAKSVSEFGDCQYVSAVESSEGEPYSITNRGVKISIPVLETRLKGEPAGTEFLARLSCTKSRAARHMSDGDIGIRIKLMTRPNNLIPTQSHFARVNCSSTVNLGGRRSTQEKLRENMYFRQQIKLPSHFRSSRIGGIRFTGLEYSDFPNGKIWPPNLVITAPYTIRSLNANENLCSFRILFSTNAGRRSMLPQGSYLLISIDFNDTERSVISTLLSPKLEPPFSYTGNVCLVTSSYKVENRPTSDDFFVPGDPKDIIFPINFRLEIMNDQLMMVAHILTVFKSASKIR